MKKHLGMEHLWKWFLVVAFLTNHIVSHSWTESVTAINAETEVNYDKSFHKKCGLLTKAESNSDKAYLHSRISPILAITA